MNFLVIDGQKNSDKDDKVLIQAHFGSFWRVKPVFVDRSNAFFVKSPIFAGKTTTVLHLLRKCFIFPGEIQLIESLHWKS